MPADARLSRHWRVHIQCEHINVSILRELVYIRGNLHKYSLAGASHREVHRARAVCTCASGPKQV